MISIFNSIESQCRERQRLHREKHNEDEKYQFSMLDDETDDRLLRNAFTFSIRWQQFGAF